MVGARTPRLVARRGLDGIDSLARYASVEQSVVDVCAKAAVNSDACDEHFLSPDGGSIVSWYRLTRYALAVQSVVDDCAKAVNSDACEAQVQALYGVWCPVAAKRQQ